MKRRGLIADESTNILMWIIFLILAGLAIWFIVKQLSA